MTSIILKTDEKLASLMALIPQRRFGIVVYFSGPPRMHLRYDTASVGEFEIHSKKRTTVAACQTC